jgi:hypothetical protein
VGVGDVFKGAGGEDVLLVANVSGKALGGPGDFLLVRRCKSVAGGQERTGGS